MSHPLRHLWCSSERFDAECASPSDQQSRRLAATCERDYHRHVLKARRARISEGDQVIYERNTGNPAMRKDWIVSEHLKLNGTTWDMMTWPTPALAHGYCPDCLAKEYENLGLDVPGDVETAVATGNSDTV